MPACLAVASGKGGVGKSSITANLAAALAQRGFAVGVIDADIWGFSIPRMLGLEGRLERRGHRRRRPPHPAPLGRRSVAGRLDVVSMGLLVDDETDALMWRGLILNRAVQHFLEDVAWADDLDYLVIDLPPGTGDVQMGLARMLPQAEMIVVTTPALAAQRVASRAVTMARKSHLHVLGVIENMSAFRCEHGRAPRRVRRRRRRRAGRRGRRAVDRHGAPRAGRLRRWRRRRPGRPRRG